MDTNKIKKIPSQRGFDTEFIYAIETGGELINIERIIEHYNKSSNDARYLINDIFISLTGYQLTTLVDRTNNENDR